MRERFEQDKLDREMARTYTETHMEFTASVINKLN